MGTICVVSVELQLFCARGRLLWAMTLTKQWDCVWLFEKGCARVQPVILALHLNAVQYTMRGWKHIKKKQGNKGKEIMPRVFVNCRS